MTTLHAMGGEHEANGDSESSKPVVEPPPRQSETRSAELAARLFEECGGNPVAQIRIERNERLLRHESLRRPFLLIGSDPRCHVCLPGADMKPQHFLLQWIEGSIFCCDLSVSPSPLSGKKTPLIGRWLDHEPIKIDRYRLSLENFTPPSPPNFSPIERQSNRRANLPQIGLRFAGVSEVDNIWKFDRRLVLIGKSSLCKLRLNHPTIAGIQSWLLQTNASAWLIDFAGVDSTKVNGEAIQLAPIDIGDQVEFEQFNVEVISTEFLFTAPPVNDSLTRNQTAPPLATPSQSAPVQSASSTNPYDQSLPPIRFDRPLENANSTNPLMEPLSRSPIPFPSDLPPAPALVDVSLPLPSEDFSNERISDVATVEELIEELVVEVVDEPQSDPLIEAIEIYVEEDIVPAIPTEVSEVAESIIEEIPSWHVETIAPARAWNSRNTKPAVVAVPVSLPTIGVRLQPSAPSTTRLRNYQSVSTSLLIGEQWHSGTPKTQQIGSAYFPAEQAAMSADVVFVEQQIPPVLVRENAGPSNEVHSSIGDFIEAQRAELARLRACLNEFQLAYESAAGSLISRKVRESLERPVLATTECCDALIRNLDRFTPERNPPAE